MSIEVKGFEKIKDTFEALQILNSKSSALLGEHVARPLYNRSVRAFENQKSAFDSKSWQKLSDKTLKAKKGKGKTLYHSGSLQNTFAWSVKDNTAFIGTNAKFRGYPYPAVHQFGSKFVPKRPFLPIDDNYNISEDEVKKIEKALEKKIEKLLN
ncbi:MAG: phage virion morphogenesis protein [Campylobacteraceae bacterium]